MRDGQDREEQMDDKLDLSLPPRGRGKDKGSRHLVILVVILLAVALVDLFVSLHEGGRSAPPAISSGKLMDVALRLEKQGLYEPAVEIWKDYLKESKPGREESAKIWYRIGKLYQEDGRYAKAVSAYYISEEIGRVEEIAHEISTRTAECLEKMGRFAALDYELERRTSFAARDSLPSDDVVAEIGPVKITRSELNRMIEAELESQLAQMAGDLSPEERREQKRKLLDSIVKGNQVQAWLERLIAEEVLYRRAREKELGDVEEIRRMIDSVERKLLAQKYLEQEYAKRIVITPDELKSYYEAHKDDYKTDGKQQGFDDVKDEIYQRVRMEKERDVQRQIIEELMDRYDVVIHKSKLAGSGGSDGKK